MGIAGKLAPLRRSAVFVDRFKLEGNGPVHVGTTVEHLSGERFEHEVDARLWIGLAQVPEKRHRQDRIADKAVPHDEYFSGLQFHTVSLEVR